MLITFQPEDSKDFSVDGGGLPKPPIGDYSETIKIVNIEEGMTRANTATLIVTYEFVTSISPDVVPIGFKFADAINIGHANLIPAKIARQSIAKLAYATTGDKDILAKGSFEFGSAIYNIPFKANFACKESEGGTDESGKPKVYKNISFGKLIPMIGSNQTQQAGNYNQPPSADNHNQQPAQAATTAWGQPK